MEKINVAEILKNCPPDMELDCTVYDNVYFDRIADENSFYKIECYTVFNNVKTSVRFTRFGAVTSVKNAKCVIFPKGKTTWEGFVPPIKFKDGDILAYTSSHTTVFIYRNKDNEPKYTTSFYVGYTIGCGCCCNFHIYNKSTLIALNGDCATRLATEEEKVKLFNKIKENGYKWNEETKTLEKLIVPKFKVGDRVVRKDGIGVSVLITEVGNADYFSENENSTRAFIFGIKDQDDYVLVPNKFDIRTLKPFESKVLVRDKNTNEWRGHFFSHYDNNSDTPYNCIGVEGLNEFKQCIPFEGNEHLLSTTDDCSEYYKTWE